MIPSELPRSRNFFLRKLGGFILKIMGWNIEGDFPKVPKAVLIEAPHTSNWDFVVGVAAKFVLELDVHWLGKHTLFKRPFRGVLRWLGGIPVERNASHGVVQQTVDMISQEDQFLLALSPEGTRKKVDRWKTGFYQIAKAANIPIIPVAFDYGTKMIQIGKALYPTESIKSDFGQLEAFYANVKGEHPENFNHRIYDPAEEHI
jgi:1-acyl-sn-glycerol-3-phosphate acyltransferase